MHKINIELKARAAPARVGRALASVPAPVRLPNARLDMKMLDMKMLDMKLLDMKMLDMNIADSFVTSTYFAYPNRSDLIRPRVGAPVLACRCQSRRSRHPRQTRRLRTLEAARARHDLLDRLSPFRRWRASGT